MAARTYATMDKLCGMQQGLETSMMRHKDEILKTFGARLEHICYEAENSAIQRSVAMLDPRFSALEQRIEAQSQAALNDVDQMRQTTGALTESQDGASKDIAALRAEVHMIASQLSELASHLTEEKDSHQSFANETRSHVEELQRAAGEDRQRQSDHETKVACRFETLSNEFHSAHRTASDETERSLKALSDRTAERILGVEQKLVETTKSSLNEANTQLRLAVSQLQEQINQTATQMEENKVTGRENVEGMLAETMQTLRSETRIFSEDAASAAEMFAKQHTNDLSETVQNAMQSLGNQCERSIEEACTKLHEALTTAEERLNSVNERFTKELDTLRDALQRSDALRGNLRRTLKAESLQAKRDNDELTKVSAHARDKLEVRLQESIADLSKKVNAIESRFSRDSEELQAEMRKLPTTHHVSEVRSMASNQCEVLHQELLGHSSQLNIVNADLSARCVGVKREANEAHVHLEGKVASLSAEVVSLHAAATSLTHGVVEALRIIGLVELFPSSVSAARAESDVTVGLQDLLAWERTGNSLACRVAQQWRAKDFAGNATVLTALKHRLAVEEHAVAKELLRNAPVAAWTGAPLPPVSLSKGGPPHGVAKVRQQRVSQQASETAS